MMVWLIMICSALAGVTIGVFLARRGLPWLAVAIAILVAGIGVQLLVIGSEVQGLGAIGFVVMAMILPIPMGVSILLSVLGRVVLGRIRATPAR